MSNRAVGIRVNIRCPEGPNALLHASEHVGPIGGVHKMHRLLLASDVEELVWLVGWMVGWLVDDLLALLSLSLSLSLSFSLSLSLAFVLDETHKKNDIPKLSGVYISI